MDLLVRYMITSNPYDFSSIVRHVVFPTVREWSVGESNSGPNNSIIKTYYMLFRSFYLQYLVSYYSIKLENKEVHQN